MKLAPARSGSHLFTRRLWIIVTIIALSLNYIVLDTRPVFSQEIVLTDHAMCQGVNPQTELPLNRTAKFLSSDKQAVSWLEAEIKEIGPAHFVWHWVDPQGRIYKNTTRIENFVSTGPRRLWDVLPIRGRTENMTGNWTVKVYFRARPLLSETFTIDPLFYQIRVTAKGLGPTCKVNVYLDDKKYGLMTGPSTQALTLFIGASHNVSVDSVSYVSNQTRFVCASNWRIVTSKTDLVFEYEAQHYLRIRSEYGGVEPNADGWYRNGTRAMFRIKTPIVGTFGVRYLFVSWSGDLSNGSPFAMVVMDRPRTIVAIWKADYTILYVSAGLIATVLCGVLFFSRRRTRSKAT